MKPTLSCTLLFAIIGSSLFAQNVHFVQNGIIEYEKRSNMYALIKKKINKNNEAFWIPAFDAYKRDNTQFKLAKSTMYFTADKSLYKFSETKDVVNNSFISNDAFADLKNTTATDFKTGISTTQKNVYDAIYLVKDSVRKISWKITDETREIAGYDCRRANAVIMDSVYVVAYYANQIGVSGGPESFTGLPGMILGIVLPHENLTWFATKVIDTTIPEKELLPPLKGKVVDNKTLRKILISATKDWNVSAQQIFKAYSL